MMHEERRRSQKMIINGLLIQDDVKFPLNSLKHFLRL